MRGLGRLGALGASLLLTAFMGPGPAAADAQGGGDDGQTLLSRLAEGDSLATAAADTLDAPTPPPREATGFDWFASLNPSVKAVWTADVSRTQLKGDLVGNLVWLDGAQTNATLSRSETSFRQQDRDQSQTNFNANLTHRLAGRAKLRVDVSALRNQDENRLSNGGLILLEQNNDRAKMELSGGTSLVRGIRQRWTLSGQYEDARQVNRGTRNNRSLLKGGVSSRWVKEASDWTLRAKFGLLGESGTRQLLTLDADASARVDTLGIELDADLPSKWKLGFSAERMHEVEERLDLARNSSGLIDTTGVAAEDQVGEERESRVVRRLSLDLEGRLGRALGLRGSAGHSFNETQYAFSPQGIVQNGQDDVEGRATLRYAESGSLRTKLSFVDRYNDRRTRESAMFRGRESRQTKEFRLDLNQQLFAATDLEFNYRQTLTQTINDDVTNKNDRDLLVSRLDAEVESDAIPRITLSAGATYSLTDEINIDAERVGNNKRDRLVEVRGGYTIRPNSSLQFLQNYRLQIVFVDQFASNDRDQFNKQAQLRNELSYVFASGPSFRFEYLVDFRRNGTRDAADIYRETYIRNLRRFDHQLTARMNVPLKGLDLEAWTKRSYLREQRRSTDNQEDRGEVHLRVKGNRSVWSNRATLSLDLERILQFGPRVREEAQDYWKANTSLSVVF